MPPRGRFVVRRPSLLLDGDKSSLLASRLTELLIVADGSGPSRCHASFEAISTRDPSLCDRSLLDYGKTIEVQIEGASAFKGTIVGLAGDFSEQGPPVVTVIAEDGLLRLRGSTRTRTFEQTSRGEVIRRLAADHGLAVSVQVASSTPGLVAQANQDDLSMLFECARALDADVRVVDGTLYVQTRGIAAATNIRLQLSRNLRWFSVVADLTEQPTAITVAAWDPRRGELVSHTASAAAIADEVGTDEAATALLARFEDRTEVRGCSEQDPVQMVAETAFRQTARRFVQARGEAEADVRLCVGATVEIAGTGPLFQGRYRLTEVKHRFDASKGLRSELTCERPGLQHS